MARCAGRRVDVHRIDLHEWAHDPREYDMIASLGFGVRRVDDSKPFIRREADLLRERSRPMFLC